MNSVEKEKIFYYATQFEECCLLDGNNCETAGNIKQYDWIAAFGKKKKIECNENCFAELKTFFDENNSWIFGWLNYNLKNETEKKLYNKNLDFCNFPLLYFFVPEYIIYSQNGKIIYSENSLEEKINVFKSIDITDISETNNFKIQCNFTKEKYLTTVEKIKKNIVEGDVYELNLCMEFSIENVVPDCYTLWKNMKEKNPTPFSSFIRNKKYYSLGISPERFIYKKENYIYSQPMKGTAKRGQSEDEDNKIKTSLLMSKKERSENIMIVDLVRNDLARSAKAGTVSVVELFGIYEFKNAFQMVSTVKAEAKNNIHFTEIIQNAFPMGSMTGCPKTKAMQLIDEYEPSSRGIFSGSVGYVLPNGDFDFNVMIRSIAFNAETKYLSYHAGSAITFLSDAEKEYEECLLKASWIESVL